MRYRLEYYLPAARRVYGYFVMPFLLGERLVARVDAKADRRGRALVVPAVWAEPGADAAVVPEEVAAALAEELRQLADWLGLDRVALAAGHPGQLNPLVAAAL
ncbi:MAG: winged helix DNA-binding domain-containing protein, partial [Bifidobacteriaceae bacterium]|jgi:uncharacterized protein YcaQ|nr:winged helix DNA-binding domain-containing protein [Bifidobacteriaceae bacterium]